MSMNAGVHVPYAFMTSSAPVSPALSKSAPSPDTSFEFPSIPPRLKSIGRQLSQMGENFLPPGVDDSPNSRTSSVSRSRTVEEVPGMGDEPVLCPFCNKPLPPAIFTSHNHRPVKHNRGNLAMSPANASKEPLPAPKLLEPLSVAKPEKKESTPLSTEGMQEMVQQGDEANMAAAKSLLTSDEIEQWAKRAGITLQPPKPAEPEKPIPALAPPPPPASKLSNPLAARSDFRPGPKFGFFSGSSTDAEGDSDSDDVGGGGAGYSRLTAPGSPTDDEGENPNRRLHDEPDQIEYIVDEEKEKEVEPEPEVPVELEKEKEDETKILLREVLSKVDEMAKSQASLLASHSSLLTSLKIARSNLSMAEANTEMLEEQLKRGRSGTFSGHLGGAAGSPVTPANPTRQTPQTSGAAVPRAVTNPTRSATATTSANTTPARKLDETKRPTSLQIPASASNSAQTQNVSSANGKDEGKGWKFWNKQQKLGGVTLPSPAQVMAQIPGTPTSERPFDFSTLMPSAQAAFGLPDAPANPNVRAREIPLQRSSSMQTINGAQRPPGTPSGAATQVSELARLRAAHAAAQTKIETMSKELVELKKGKVDMEAELENLSQALFEEANKMVADERRRRAEIEELLKEVREEREALRSTIKVLGGKVEEEAQAAGEEEVVKVDEAKDSEDPDFVPRDLDKHYEALRKTIHHVSDGVSTAGGIPDLSMVSNMPVLEEGPHEEDEMEELDDVAGEMDVSRLAASEPNLLGIGVGNTSLGAELNPWADPFANAAATMSTIIPPGQAALPGEEELRPTRNAFFDEVAPDVAGEGEPPSVVEGFGDKQDVAP